MPSPHTQSPNADNEETAQERTTRHLRACRRITELAMALAEAAAETAIQELAEPAEPPTPRTPRRAPAHPPQISDEQALQSLQTEIETTASPTQTPNPPISAATQFTRFCRVALTAIALETRIAAEAARQAATHPVWRSPDPRRASLTHALHLATAGRPDAPILRRDMETRLDDALEADPTATAEIVRTICAGYGIHIKQDPGPMDPGRDLYELLGLWPTDTG